MFQRHFVEHNKPINTLISLARAHKYGADSPLYPRCLRTLFESYMLWFNSSLLSLLEWAFNVSHEKGFI